MQVFLLISIYTGSDGSELLIRWHLNEFRCYEAKIEESKKGR